MQSISVFLDMKKSVYFQRKNADVMRIKGLYHVIYIFSVFSLGNM